MKWREKVTVLVVLFKHLASAMQKLIHIWMNLFAHVGTMALLIGNVLGRLFVRFSFTLMKSIWDNKHHQIEILRKQLGRARSTL